MSLLLAPILKYIVAILGFGGAIFVAVLKGRDQVKGEVAQKTVEAAKSRAATDDAVTRMKHADLAEKLSTWERK